MSDRVLITGGAGFIGSHLADALVAEGSAVTVLDDLSTGVRHNLDRALAGGRCRLVVGSVLDTALVDRLTRRQDRVFHMAAMVGMRRVLADPLRTLVTNVRGTENVLAAADRAGATAILASTSEVYGRGEGRRRLLETAARSYGSVQGGRWAYAESKALDEMLGLAYGQARGADVRIVRLFNVVGPRQLPHHGMVLPRFARAAIRREPLVVYGDGTQRRCFSSVDDVVRVVRALSELAAAGGTIYNVGAPHPISIGALARLVRSRAGSTSAIVHRPYAQVYGPDFEDVDDRQPDLERLTAAVGPVSWRPVPEIVDAVLADHDRRTRRRPRPTRATRPRAGAGAAPRVDVVVVAYRSAATLRACVEPLAGVSDLNVIVVDNGCPERSAEGVRDLGVTVVSAPRNEGFAAGSNRGARRGRAGTILFLNPDARIAPAAVRRLAAAFDGDPRLGATAPSLRDADGAPSASVGREVRLVTAFSEALFLHHLAADAGWASALAPADAAGGPAEWLIGACLCVRRTAFERVGGFDQRFFLYGEDVDLCTRLRGHGYAVRSLPGVEAVHHGQGSGPRSAVHVERGRVVYARLHERGLRYAGFRAAFVLHEAVRLPVAARRSREEARERARALSVTLRPARSALARADRSRGPDPGSGGG